jgi:hypothetical protein
MANLRPHDEASQRGPNWSGINHWLPLVGLAAVAAWLFYRHAEHVWSLLPFLIVLACPLMHLFGHGHGGHGGHGGRNEGRGRSEGDSRTASGGG